jgi:hypothetical protein
MSVHPGSIWLDNNWSQLPRDFWVAADNNGIVSEDKDLANVYSELRRRGINLPDVTIAYVPDGVIQ